MRGRAWREAETLGHTQSWNRDTGVWSSCWPVADPLQTKLWQDLLHHCGRRNLFLINNNCYDIHVNSWVYIWTIGPKLAILNMCHPLIYMSCQYIANLSCCFACSPDKEPLSFHDPMDLAICISSCLTSGKSWTNQYIHTLSNLPQLSVVAVFSFTYMRITNKQKMTHRLNLCEWAVHFTSLSDWKGDQTIVFCILIVQQI